MMNDSPCGLVFDSLQIAVIFSIDDALLVNPVIIALAVVVPSKKLLLHPLFPRAFSDLSFDVVMD